MDWSSYAEVMTTTLVVERNDYLRWSVIQHNSLAHLILQRSSNTGEMIMMRSTINTRSLTHS